MGDINLRKFVRLILHEVVLTTHVKDRFKERFLSTRIMGIGVEKMAGEYEELGTYTIDNNVINALSEKFNILSTKSFPKNKSYAIKLMDIPINIDHINFFSPQAKMMLLTNPLLKSKIVLLNDSAHDSNGNCVYVIIRGGEIITVMLVKNYVKMTPDKMNVDFIITNWDLIIQNKVR